MEKSEREEKDRSAGSHSRVLEGGDYPCWGLWPALPVCISGPELPRTGNQGGPTELARSLGVLILQIFLFVCSWSANHARRSGLEVVPLTTGIAMVTWISSTMTTVGPRGRGILSQRCKHWIHRVRPNADVSLKEIHRTCPGECLPG